MIEVVIVLGRGAVGISCEMTKDASAKAGEFPALVFSELAHPWPIGFSAQNIPVKSQVIIVIESLAALDILQGRIDSIRDAFSRRDLEANPR